jgi:LmbE family N-acetylglucosaminyl deacetylase
LIFNNVVQFAPFVLGKRTRRLWPEALASSVIGLLIGFLAVVKYQLGVEIAAIVVGLLLFFRALIELAILVESNMRAYHQRWLILWVALSLVFGVYIIMNPFGEERILEKVLGIYAILIGLNHVLVASRKSHVIVEREELTHSEINSDNYVPVETMGELHFDEHPPSSDNREIWEPIKPGDKINVSKYKRPIVIAAHPDDLEAFAGGLVFQLGNVLSVIFSGGDRGVWSPKYSALNKSEYIRLRLKESSEAGKILGVNEIIYMGYLDRTIKCTDDNVQKISTILEKYEPDIIVSFEYHESTTLDPHPDHLAVGEITRRAVKKYVNDDRFDYLVMSTIFPNVFVDVSDVRRVKLEALARHTSQTGLNSIIFPFLEKLITKLWGAYNGVDYAEGYRCVQR